jgi:putative zinc finger protein
MSDQFTEQLSPYLDGELDDPRRARLEAHLAGCADCAAVLADLRAIVAAAPAYPGREPEADLWPGIEERLGSEGRRGGKADRAEVMPFLPSAVPPVRRFSLPQLLAASIAMAALSGGSVWLALRGRSVPTGAQRVAVAPSVDTAIGLPADSAPVRRSAGPPDRPSVLPSFRPSVRSASLAGLDDAGYDRAVRDLERVLDAGRSRLDSTTVATIEGSLAKIDAAIAEARAAIQRDPANAYLRRQIASNMRRKVDLLRVAANAIAART